MVGTILSLLGALALVAVAGISLAKRRTLVNGTLGAAALLLAGIEVANQVALHELLPIPEVQQGILFCESLLPFAFMLLSNAYALQKLLGSRSVWSVALLATTLLFPLVVLFFPLHEFFYDPDFGSERMLFLGNVGYWFYLGIMIYSIAALVKLEMIFSATSGAARWKMKYEIIGLASILAMLVFYYSQGLLYRTVNMNVLPVKGAVFMIASLLIGYSKLMRGDDARVVVSRYVLYRSLVLMLVGIYLVGLGLIGEGMKYFGDSFGKNALLFVGFATGIVIVIILSSEQFRRAIKVIVVKHFYAHKHDYRDVWLTFTSRLAACRSLADMAQTILSIYRELFGLKGASLYLFDKERAVYRLTANQEMRDEAKEVRLSPGLVSYFVQRSRALSPGDGEYLPTDEERSFIGQVKAALIIPLIAGEDLIGLIIMGEQISRDAYIFEDYDLMKIIARQAALAIANARLSEELGETRELAAVARVSSFIIHDLKNLSYSLSLLLENADNHIDNPAFQKDMISAIRNSVNRMKTLMQRLKEVPEKGMLHGELVSLDHLVAEVAEEVTQLKKGLSISYHGTPAHAVADRDEIKKVALNLLLNAADAIAEGGSIQIETGMQHDVCYIKVQDTGCGMTEEFIAGSLFRPFTSTKKSGLGIGLYHCRQIVAAHEGRIEVQSEPGKGSVFTVYLPHARRAEGK